MDNDDRMCTFEAVQGDPAVRPVVGYHDVAHAQIERGDGSDAVRHDRAAFLQVVSATKGVGIQGCAFRAVVGARPRKEINLGPPQRTVSSVRTRSPGVRESTHARDAVVVAANPDYALLLP